MERTIAQNFVIGAVRLSVMRLAYINVGLENSEKELGWEIYTAWRTMLKCMLERGNVFERDTARQRPSFIQIYTNCQIIVI